MLFFFFFVLHLWHLWVTAQQNRVPRLLLNEPEIRSHYLGYRNIIFNSGCFSDPRHCQCSSPCLKQIFSHAPLHIYVLYGSHPYNLQKDWNPRYARVLMTKWISFFSSFQFLGVWIQSNDKFKGESRRNWKRRTGKKVVESCGNSRIEIGDLDVGMWVLSRCKIEMKTSYSK